MTLRAQRPARRVRKRFKGPSFNRMTPNIMTMLGIMRLKDGPV